MLLRCVLLCLLWLPALLAAEPGMERQVRDLISRYSHAVDAGEVEAIVNLFVDDGELITPVGSPQGSAALREWAQQRIDSREPRIQVRHMVVNTLIAPVNSSRVRARSMLLYTRQNIDKPLSAEVMATGIYEDIIVHTANGWRFQQRRMEVAPGIDPIYFKRP